MVNSNLKKETNLLVNDSGIRKAVSINGRQVDRKGEAPTLLVCNDGVGC